jgi:cell wall-associated NlpC family hydrolase
MKKILTSLIASTILLMSFISVAIANPLTGEENLSASNQTISTEDVNKTSWSDRAREVLLNALSLSGIRYRSGGNTPDTGFDCSGFVRYVFKQATSLTLPRSALAMSQLGTSVRKNELQPGDLVFFNTLKSAFSHVGIYVGNNRFIHSPRSGGVVRIDSLDSEYWVKHFDGAKRIDANKDATNNNATD